MGDAPLWEGERTYVRSPPWPRPRLPGARLWMIDDACALWHHRPVAARRVSECPAHVVATPRIAVKYFHRFSRGRVRKQTEPVSGLACRMQDRLAAWARTSVECLPTAA